MRFVYCKTSRNKPDGATAFLCSGVMLGFSASVEGPRAQLHPTSRALASAVQRGGIPEDQGPHQDGENSRVLAQPPTATASHQSRRLNSAQRNQFVFLFS